MPYIAKSPSGLGVRTRFLYTATASQTTFSGADTQNLTLSYSDSNFIDVYQNGVLLKIVDDYTATSDLVFNYLKRIDLNGIEDLNIIQFKDSIQSDLNSFWLICYTPRVNFECNVSNLKKWKLKKIKKKYLVEAKLFKSH